MHRAAAIASIQTVSVALPAVAARLWLARSLRRWLTTMPQGKLEASRADCMEWLPEAPLSDKHVAFLGLIRVVVSPITLLLTSVGISPCLLAIAGFITTLLSHRPFQIPRKMPTVSARSGMSVMPCGMPEIIRGRGHFMRLNLSDRVDMARVDKIFSVQVSGTGI
jgi:hypothetical protein